MPVAADVVPFIELPAIGPVNSFGLLVVLGVFVGSTAAFRHSERLGLDQGRVRQLALFCGLAGLFGAHIVDVLLYQPGWMNRDGAVWTLLNPFAAGISSMGGVLGATLGFFLFAHVTRIKRLKFADTASFGLLVLLTFGRAGCASVHDHVGVASELVFAVDFPAGNPIGVVGPHHDLGLYEFALLVVLLTIAAIVIRRPRRPGVLVGILAIGYSVPRFFLDFLRRPLSDPRYFELTPAQWSTLAMFAAGIVVLWSVHRRDKPAPLEHFGVTPWREYITNVVRTPKRVNSG